MKKLYVIRLSEEERSELMKLVKTGRAPAYRRRHAEILLQADQGQHGPALHDRQIVDGKHQKVWGNCGTVRVMA